MVLGLAVLTVSAPGLFLAVPFIVVGLVPFVTVLVTEVVLACPTGFLSGTLVWLLTEEEAAAAVPIGLLGIAPAADFAFVAVFLTVAAETLLEALTSFTVR